MSVMETAIWYTLGYLVMPMIFLAGYAATAFIACLLIDWLKLDQKTEA
ncbi:MAG: TIGR02808 family protein [Endozoicomonas sp.]